MWFWTTLNPPGQEVRQGHSLGCFRREHRSCKILAQISYLQLQRVQNRRRRSRRKCRFALLLNVMHFVDLDQAIAEVGRQHKPGGTFCVVMHGVLAFRDHQIYQAYVDFHHVGMRNVFATCMPWEKCREAMIVTGSTCDDVPLPESVFEPGAQRIKLNLSKDNRAFYNPQMLLDLRAENPQEPRIRPHDEVIHRDDLEWAFKCDIAALRDHVAMHPWGLQEPEMKKAFEEVEHAIGDAKVDAYWPVALILATKK